MDSPLLCGSGKDFASNRYDYEMSLREFDDWSVFLRRWSGEWIDTHADRARPLPPEAIRDRWLGFPPADPATVANAEARLSVRLPPSYQEFLSVTDGWRYAGSSIFQLLPVEEIGWLADLQPHWAESHADDQLGPVLRRALVVSGDADMAVIVLDPGDVNDDGEWAAYWMASWSPQGEKRYESFASLMYGMFARFHAVERPVNATSQAWDARVDAAYRSALAGDADDAMEGLAEASRFGRPRAQVLRFQARVLLGESLAAAADVGGTVMLRPSPDLIADPAYAAVIVPLYVAARERLRHRRSQRRSAELLDLLPSTLPKEVKDLFRAELERQRAGRYPRLSATDQFEAAAQTARRLVGEGSSEGAWLAISESVPRWQPVSGYDLAPAFLCLDPVLGRLLTPERGESILRTPRALGT